MPITGSSHRPRVKAAAVGSLAAACLVSTTGAAASAEASTAPTAKHVLLISVDGLHASDLATCEAAAALGAPGACPTLAALSGYGTTYTHTTTSSPSDSAPGLMGLVSGGDPKLTGVYYDDSYARNLYAPPAQTSTGTQNCHGTPGAETMYAENIDRQAPTYSNPNGNRPIIGATIDPAQLPRGWYGARCEPVFPNNFMRADTVFSVAHAAGLHTAWADKHPVYNQEISGPGDGNAVSDPFNTEINADSIPPALTDTRGKTITFPLPNPDGTGPYFITDSVGDTEAYDQIKVDALLNEIDGWNSAHTRRAPVPAIFGMNFQTVSVAQKLVDPLLSCQRTSPPPANCDPNYVPGGYEPGSTSDHPVFTPQLDGAVQSVDRAVASLVDELKAQGALGSTTIIITAKHGQSPIDPSRLAKIGHAETTVLESAGITPAQVTDDDVALVWLTNHAQTPAAVAALNNSIKNGNPARIKYVLTGEALRDRFGSPTSDPRTPDLIIQPLPGTIYSSSTAKVAEHGGFTADDTHVALLVVDGARLLKAGPAAGSVVTAPVTTYQVAPTILRLLGLDTYKLDAVRVEHVQVLPGQ